MAAPLLACWPAWGSGRVDTAAGRAMDKADFVRACREGGPRVEAALRELHRDYAGALLADATRTLRDEHQARDLLQDTLIKAWRRCASFRGESELFPWLRQVLRRSLIDGLRQQHPQASIDDPDALPPGVLEQALQRERGTPPGQPEAELQAAQHDAVFRRCAERFAAEQPQAAAVIGWIAEDGLDAAAIAQLLGRSPGATREFISQCRKKARLYFADWHRLVSERGEPA